MGTDYAAENRALENVLRQKELFPNTSAPWQQKILDDFLISLNQGSDSICLDAACGIGNNIRTLLKHVSKIVAFDKSTKALEFARERYKEYLPERISFVSGSLESFPLPDNFYDLVTCTEALEHVKDCDLVVRNIFRVTKPGGYVVLSFQNHLNLSALLKYGFEAMYKKNWDAWGTHGYKEGYENYLTCFQMKSSVKKAGFISKSEFGADYINAWLSWVPFFYRNYKILDYYPVLFLGKIPFLKYLGMDYFMLLQKPEL